MIAYDETGVILCSSKIEPHSFEIFKKSFNNDTLYLPNEYVDDLYKYKVKDGVIIPLSDDETLELIKYRRFLNGWERELNKLKPSHEEIQKAENTIEILTLLSEVL